MRALTALLLLLLPWAARAADEWRIEAPPTAKPPAKEAAAPRPPSEAAPLDDATARALLDYRQYRRVERAMRARLRRNPDDAAALRLLARALEGQGRRNEARAARARADELAGAARPALELSLAAFADSNLVAAPDALGLAARDRGDVGLALALAAAGEAGRIGWHAGFAGRRLQDLRAYDLDRFALGAGMRPDERTELGLEWVAMRLGRARLFDEAALYLVRGGDDGGVEMEGRLARRWFAAAYGGYGGWRAIARAGLVRADARRRRRMRVGLLLGDEHARDPWLRRLRLGLEGSLRLGLMAHARLVLRASVELRPYLAADPRPFLRAPRRRRDLVLAAGARLEAPFARRWTAFAAADVRDQRSNFDAGAVRDPVQSRSWRRWRLYGGVQWSP